MPEGDGVDSVTAQTMQRIKDEWTAPLRAEIDRLRQRDAVLAFELGNVLAEAEGLRFALQDRDAAATEVRLRAADNLAAATALVVSSVQSPHMNTEAWVEQDLTEALEAYRKTQ